MYGAGYVIQDPRQEMRAITVSPGIANSARLDDVPEPPAVGRRGSGAHRGAGRVRHRPRNPVGRLRLGAAGRAAAGARPRIARARRSGAGGLRPGARRPRGRHRAPARSGAVPGLRRRRMGHVPQRALHRARHQGAPRLRRRALPARAGIRGQGRSGTGHSRRAARARQHPGQGLGPHRAHRRARARLAAAQPCWSPAPARSGCWPRSWECSAISMCTSSTTTTPVRSRRWCAISARPITATSRACVGSHPTS